MKDSIVPSLLDQLDGESNIKMIMVTRYILEIICRKPLSEDVVIQAMDSVAKLEAGGACNWDLRRLDISVAKPYVKALWRYSKSDKDMDSTLSSAVDLQKITMHL